MLRGIAVLGTVAVVFGGLSMRADAAGPPPQDVSHYTINCDTLSKGVVQFKPSLIIGGTAPETTKVKGTLSGCTATPDGTNPAITVISGSVSGLLNSATNDCLSLLGPSSATGSITIKWKTVQKIAQTATTITIGAGNVSGGTATPFADSATYGQFNISGTTDATGSAFGGATGTGSGSFTKSITVQGISALGAACTPPALGLKAVNLGPTEVGLQ